MHSIYTMISEQGKLNERTVTFHKSDGPYDMASQQYISSDKPTNPDCMCLVFATKLKSGNISEELKNDEGELKNQVKSMVTETVSGRIFNNLENKQLANDIVRNIRAILRTKNYRQNCSIGVIIADPELEYVDGMISSSYQKMLKMQVICKTYQFKVIVLIVFLP